MNPLEFVFIDSSDRTEWITPTWELWDFFSGKENGFKIIFQLKKNTIDKSVRN